MTTLMSQEQIEEYLEDDDLKYFVPKIGQICLPMLVRLLFNNKFGEPLDLAPFQCVMLHLLWTKKFPMVLACRGAGKTFMLAIYAILRALLVPGSKIVIVGGGFRQSKLVFGYIEEILQASPILQETVEKGNGARNKVKYATDRVSLRVGTNSEIIGLPVGDGSKIRGVRATVLIADETASISESVFDVAILPFLSVKADPVQSAKLTRFTNRLEALGASSDIVNFVRASQAQGNQLVLSGTASFEFNHFYRRYCVYKLFAESKGDIKTIKEALAIQNPDRRSEFTDRDLQRYAATWDQYAIFQLPYHAMPEGFLDEDIVASHRATMNDILFGQEYECKFSKDSNGFFPRSLIYAATPDINASDVVHYEVIGDPKARYVMGVDPARWNDNFAIVILKLDGPKAKIVYCESWRRTDWPKSVKRFRELLGRFNVVHVAMDQGGGGDHFSDILANADYLQPGEQPITRFEDDEHKLIPDRIDLIELINFHTWSKEANHAMYSDIRTQRLLFPGQVDESKIMAQAAACVNSEDADTDFFKFQLLDMIHGTTDKNDDLVSLGVVREIDAMIDETCAIEQMVTDKGTETFALPKLKDQPEGLDVRRRDRYSALLLAAYAARQVRGTGFDPKLPDPVGGTPSQILNSRSTNYGTYAGPTLQGGVIIP